MASASITWTEVRCGVCYDATRSTALIGKILLDRDGTVQFAQFRRQGRPMEEGYVWALSTSSKPMSDAPLRRDVAPLKSSGRSAFDPSRLLDDGLHRRCRDRHKHRVGLSQADLIERLKNLDGQPVLWLPAL